MKTVLEVLKLTADYLQKQGIDHARRQAEELISAVLGIERVQLYMQFERPLNENELSLCREHLKRRIQGEPLQYIQGQVEFLDCTLKVTKDVLIPRQETEILTDKIYQELSKQDLTEKILWDLCCGSGCIGIALKKKLPTLAVVLSDVSSAALAVAKSNAELNNVDVTLVQGDLLEPFYGQRAHFVTCNPPYIALGELPTLEKEVRDFEPQLALIAGATGLEFYVRLAKELPDRLYSGGKAWFELGRGQGAAVKALFSGKQWKRVEVEKDWSGHDRFFFLEIE